MAFLFWGEGKNRKENHPQIHMESQTTLNRQNNLEKAKLEVSPFVI